jgi:hypothetical protein
MFMQFFAWYLSAETNYYFYETYSIKKNVHKANYFHKPTGIIKYSV